MMSYKKENEDHIENDAVAQATAAKSVVKKSETSPKPVKARTTVVKSKIAKKTIAAEVKSETAKLTKVRSTVTKSKTPTTTAAKTKPTKSVKSPVAAIKPKVSRAPSPVTKTSPIKKDMSSSEVTLPWLKCYPEDINWRMEINPKPVYSFLDESAWKGPNLPCVDFLGKKYTYFQIAHLVNCAAKGLQKLGIQKNDRVGIFMPNSVYFVIMYHAILKVGGIVVNYNPLYVDHEISHQINDSDTKIMATLDLKILYDKLDKQVQDPQSALKKLIICPLATTMPFPKNLMFKIFKRKNIAAIRDRQSVVNFADLTNNDGAFQPVAIDPVKDVAVLQYTGGTTGVPKAAMLTHKNVYANAVQAEAWFKGIEWGNERILAALPLFHVYAMTAAMTLSMRIGGEIILMFPRFDVLEAIKAIAKHKVTFFPAVPTMYGMIAHHPGVNKRDLSSLKACLSGGATLPFSIKEEFETLTGCKLVEAYGLSETSPAATSNPFFGVNKKNSIGVPFPGTEVKILSLEDTAHWTGEGHVREMPAGEKGQIAIKGPQVMLGYWKQPDETKCSFYGDYFLTGDVGYMDEDGYTFLVDRIKDLIICSGFNVYPCIVEEGIYKHPAVSEVTVIGIPDEKRGETVKAFVKLRSGASLTESELLDFLQDKLSPIEIPKVIEFRDELPKTMVGKLSRKELREEYSVQS